MSDNAKRGLGMGIAALLGDSLVQDIKSNNHDKKIVELPISLIDPNPGQPRKHFNEEKLKELSESILINGLLQPILVTENNGRYTIIAGERRYRASKKAGLPTIKSIVLSLNEKEILKNAIIENIQRDDLNPVEEAMAYRQMIENFGYRHEDIAKEVSKSRSHITNLLRILQLPEDVLSHISRGTISLGHAKVLLGTDNPADLLDEILASGMSVRELEKRIARSSESLNYDKSGADDSEDAKDITFQMIKQLYEPMLTHTHEQNNQEKVGREESDDSDEIDYNVLSIEEKLSEKTGLDIKLKIDKLKGNGKLIISYNTSEELANIIQSLFIK